MIAAALLAAAQPIAPATAIDTLTAACIPGVTDAQAFADAARRLGFTPVEERGRGALYRAGESELRHVPGQSCSLRASIATREEAIGVIERISTELGLPAPQPIAMHPPGWTSYRWPNADATTPRFYLAARTIIDHEGAVSLELTIHRGPAQ